MRGPSNNNVDAGTVNEFGRGVYWGNVTELGGVFLVGGVLGWARCSFDWGQSLSPHVVSKAYEK